MNKEELIKTLKTLIEEVVEMANEDPLKAYIYLQHKLKDSPPQVTGALPAIWSQRKEWRKEGDLVGKGHEKFVRSLEKEMQRLRDEKLEKLYQEMFPNEQDDGTT